MTRLARLSLACIVRAAVGFAINLRYHYVFYCLVMDYSNRSAPQKTKEDNTEWVGTGYVQYLEYRGLDGATRESTVALCTPAERYICTLCK